MKEIQDLINCLNVFKRTLVITTHRNPDGDAIGSCLALKSVLDAHLHVVNVVVPSDFPDDLSWLHGSGEIYVYDREQDKSLELIKSAEGYFVLITKFTRARG